MISFRRTDSDDADFKELVRQLDAELKIRDGEDHAFYNQFNSIENIGHALVAYADKRPVGCGAIKKFGTDSMEVKRMFVVPVQRGRGIARKVLEALEQWAAELNCTSIVLETGLKQPEALSLYQKSGYSPIENYGPYVGVSNSRCFKKTL